LSGTEHIFSNSLLRNWVSLFCISPLVEKAPSLWGTTRRRASGLV